MKRWTIAVLILSLAGLGPAGVRGAETMEQKEQQTMLSSNVQASVELFKRTDSKLDAVFTTAAGYAIFPTVIKGAVGIGGAHGTGEVFAKGSRIGTATLTQVTVGAQLGGQEYAELIFFETQAALDAFAKSEWAMSAQATAVAAADGASATARYQQGVLVFTLAKGGLMFEASVGGQKFHFTPLRDVPLY